MTPDTMQDLINWLCRHEDDIKMGINDFDDLQQVFIEAIGRKAGDVPKPEISTGHHRLMGDQTGGPRSVNAVAAVTEKA